MSGNSTNNEARFTTLPHPAKSNDPGQREGASNFGNPALGAFGAAPGPVVPQEEALRSLGEPLGRDELRKRQEELRQEELNKDT